MLLGTTEAHLAPARDKSTKALRRYVVEVEN
jgi:hypothetical protein